MDSSNVLPEANRAALHRAHEAGLTICLCTGRCFAETEPVIRAIGLDLDAAVCVFGALVVDARSGRTLHRTPIPRRTAAHLLEFFRERDYPALVLHDPSEAGTDYYLVAGGGDMAAYERWLALAPTSVRRVDRWPNDAPEPLRIGIVEDPAQAVSVQAELQSEFAATELKCNAIFAPNYGLHVVECFAPQVNKWYAVAQLAHDAGIDASQVVAIGDDVNDVEMIRSAGLGVAMGNAVPAVREVARAYTGTNDEAGLARFIERLLRGEASAA